MRTIGSGKVRYAVVGAGHITQVAVLPAFAHAAENSELVALVSSDPDKLRQLAQRYGVSAHGSLDELEQVLEEADADAVYIALPNHLHRECTERAAAAGVHVLCEKPMAVTSEDCQAMIAACEREQVKLMIAYRLHFEEANLRAVDLVRSGRIGRPLLYQAALTQQVRPGNIRTRRETGGGALLDVGIYCLNAARYLFAAEPEEVFGFIQRGGDGGAQGVDESASVVMRMPGNGMAQFLASQGAAGVSQLRIIGERGDLEVLNAFDYVSERTHRLTLGDETEERTFPPQDQFGPELVYFSRCVLEGLDPEPDGTEGLADVRVLEAILASADRGRPVTLPPFERRQRPDLGQLITRPPVEKPEEIHATPPTVG
jgi:predicted dehydrogenase